MAHRVLIVDDSDMQRAALRGMLEASALDLDILEASDGEQAYAMVRDAQIDLVVTDIVMPKMDGLAFLQAVRNDFEPDSLPVILMTSDDSEDKRIQGFGHGANDFVHRPVVKEELIARVRAQLKVRALQSEFLKLSDRHRKSRIYDDLTGLVTREHLYATAKRELARSRRHKLEMSLAVAEIENYEAIYKEHGVLVGDAIVTEVAQLLAQHLRTADILGRFERGVFGMLLPHTDTEQGLLVGDRICRAVLATQFSPMQKGELIVSVGTACFPRSGVESVDELAQAAQAALARAKGHGGRAESQ